MNQKDSTDWKVKSKYLNMLYLARRSIRMLSNDCLMFNYDINCPQINKINVKKYGNILKSRTNIL